MSDEHRTHPAIGTSSDGSQETGFATPTLSSLHVGEGQGVAAPQEEIVRLQSELAKLREDLIEHIELVRSQEEAISSLEKDYKGRDAEAESYRVRAEAAEEAIARLTAERDTALASREHWIRCRNDVEAAYRSRNEELIQKVAALTAGWQPIETADKDADALLLSDGCFVDVGGWLSAADQGAEPEEEFRISAGWWLLQHSHMRPTHWMPLPAPPRRGDGPPESVQAAEPGKSKDDSGQADTTPAALPARGPAISETLAELRDLATHGRSYSVRRITGQAAEYLAALTEKEQETNDTR